MPITVKCSCGGSFKAKDSLAGRQVPCPNCKSTISIPDKAPQPATAQLAVTCSCGQSYRVRPELAGKQMKCPRCGGKVTVPDPNMDPLASDPLADPLGGSDLGDLSQFDSPLAQPARPIMPPARQKSAEPNWVLIGSLIGGGVIFVLVAIVAIMFMTGTSAPDEQSVAAVPTPAAPDDKAADDPADLAPEPPSSVPESDALPHGPAPAADVISVEPEPVAEPAEEEPQTLAGGVSAWHAGDRRSRRGLYRASGKHAESELHGFSWMTHVLPMMGHSELYDRFKFEDSWLTNDENYANSLNIVPEFLNPGDDRTRWKGYPFRELALTHFVGISGVEMTRNSVAAALPRSDPHAGVFGYDEVASREQITDGLSQTIMVIGSGEVVAPWVQGGGATVRGARAPYFDSLTGFGSRAAPGGAAIALMADGSTRHISPDIDPDVFRALCTIGGADSVDLPSARGISNEIVVVPTERDNRITIQRERPVRVVLPR